MKKKRDEEQITETRNLMRCIASYNRKRGKRRKSEKKNGA